MGTQKSDLQLLGIWLIVMFNIIYLFLPLQRDLNEPYTQVPRLFHILTTVPLTSNVKIWIHNPVLYKQVTDPTRTFL